MHYLLRRIGGAALVLSLAFIVAYVMLTALPGDAVMARYGNPDLGLSAAELAQIRTAYGADRPALLQFLDTVASFLRGDLGYSVQTGAAVSTLLAAALPSTLALALLGLLVAVTVAVVIAVAATHGGLRHLGATRALRSTLRGLPSLMVSLPVFWIGIVLLQVFSFRLGLVPVLNASPLQSLILPVLTLAIPIAAPLAQVLIRSIDEVSAEPFVAVTRARGASTRWLLTRSVARNATLPALTMAGLLFGELVGGAVVTETVFGRMGVGLVTAQAVAARDTPVLMAVVVLSAVVFVVINLVVDLLYPVLDPRLRSTTAAPARREAVAA
ncbi:MAG: ABC transporter permease [Brachybacterium sp.]|nr:ABC transporter permease [Brachybacterium sp.]